MNSHQKQTAKMEIRMTRRYLGMSLFWILFALIRIFILAPERSAIPTIVGCAVAMAFNALLIHFLSRPKERESP
jgi:hypothetical protein